MGASIVEKKYLFFIATPHYAYSTIEKLLNEFKASKKFNVIKYNKYIHLLDQCVFMISKASKISVWREYKCYFISVSEKTKIDFAVHRLLVLEDGNIKYKDLYGFSEGKCFRIKNNIIKGKKYDKGKYRNYDNFSRGYMFWIKKDKKGEKMVKYMYYNKSKYVNFYLDNIKYKKE